MIPALFSKLELNRVEYRHSLLRQKCWWDSNHLYRRKFDAL